MELSDATEKKNLATPGIDPGTFRLVALPLIIIIIIIIIIIMNL
jgi:hypothetical protein